MVLGVSGCTRGKNKVFHFCNHSFVMLWWWWWWPSHTHVSKKRVTCPFLFTFPHFRRNSQPFNLEWCGFWPMWTSAETRITHWMGIFFQKGWRGKKDLNQFQTLTTTATTMTTVCRFSALRVRQSFCSFVIVLSNCLRRNRHAVKCKTFSHNAQLRKDSFIRWGWCCCLCCYTFKLPPSKNGNTS